MTIVIDIDRIHEMIKETNAALDAEFETIHSDDQQCRVWIARLERAVRALRAGEAALLMAQDDALDAMSAEEIANSDPVGDVDANMLTVIAFRRTAETYEAAIRSLTRRERELRTGQDDGE